MLKEDSCTSDYFEQSVKLRPPEIKPKTVANWIINKKIDIAKVKPEELIKKIKTKKGGLQLSDEELEKLVEQVLKDNLKPVADYKAGKESAIMFLLGQVMRESRGRADANKLRRLLENRLKEKH